jgi:hypothetical protein
MGRKFFCAFRPSAFSMHSMKRRTTMTLVERVEAALSAIGVKELRIVPEEQEDTETVHHRPGYRVRGAVPMENGKIPTGVELEKLTWDTLPSVPELEIEEFEVVGREPDRLSLTMLLSKSRTSTRADGGPAP